MNELEHKRKIQDAILAYLGLEEADTQDWDDHNEVVNNDKELTYQEHVNAVEDRAIDLDKASLGEKIELLVDDTLNKLLTGEIVVENAQELIATIQAVDMAIDVSTKGRTEYV